MPKLLILLALVSPLLVANKAAAVEVLMGVGLIDESDDISKPGIALKARQGSYSVGLWYWGRKFGPVLEKNILITAAKGWEPFRWKIIRTEAGVAALSENTILSYSDAASENVNENFYNLGGYLGVISNFQTGPVLWNIGWQSAIFPAGLNGGLFLATGRKQVVSLSGGVQL